MHTPIPPSRELAVPLDTLSISKEVETGEGQFERLQSHDVLSPGYYWRAKESIKRKHKHWDHMETLVEAGDIHLLLDVIDFENTPHTVELLEHPAHGTGTIKLLIPEFLEKMEPVYDAEAVRAREQQDIMNDVDAIQKDMAKGELNPLALPGVQDAVSAELQKFESQIVAEHANEQRQSKGRSQDLGKMLRRAARRSAEAGNPLAVQSVPFSDQVSDMIGGGITEDGVRELTMEARRRQVIATAASTYLSNAAESMGSKLKSLAPFFGERAQVAIARSRKAINLAKSLATGLKSLNLYTGAGVDVFTIREGESAPSSSPLTLLQAKRYMAEELAVHVDVSDNFDYASIQGFYDELAKNDVLLDQLMPFPRCVLSVATTRFDVNYSDRMGAYDKAMRDIENKRVFLLVRNGGNVHVVFSGEPSHEAAARLFPSDEDLNKPFRGQDGSRIGLKDIEFSAATERFEDVALHYRRFLILLCGLDHRTKLFGEFYPLERAMEFMNGTFQATYFNFIEDAAVNRLLGQNLVPVEQWLHVNNQSVQSGSRIVITSGARNYAPLAKIRSLEIARREFNKSHIVSREGKFLYIEVAGVNRYGRNNGEVNLKVWLNKPSVNGAGRSEDASKWFFCLDQAEPEELRRYVYDRHSRSHSVEWLRVFKSAIRELEVDLAAEHELREYLRTTALAHGALESGSAQSAIQKAISTWRAARRGQPAPAVSDGKQVNELLHLMYPSVRLVEGADAMLDAFVTAQGLVPLKIARSGKNRLVLYVPASEEDKAQFALGVQWGWVKRILLEIKRTKVSPLSDSLVWLKRGTVDPTEEVVRTFPELEQWEHVLGEPARLLDLKKVKLAVEAAAVTLKQVFDRAEAHAVDPSNPRELPADAREMVIDGYAQCLKDVGTYYSSPRVVLPVGIYQAMAGAPARYLYAVIRVSKFVDAYGTADDMAALEAAALKRRFSARVFYAQEINDEKGSFWSLIETTAPQKVGVALHSEWIGDQSSMPIMSLRSHQKGGTKRRHGEKGDGRPRQDDKTVLISWSRAIDAVMGKAPLHRKAFYESIAKQIKSEKRFPAFGNDMDKAKKIARLAAQRFDSIPKPAFLSPLLWDAAAQRSHANRYFSKNFGKHLKATK